MAATPHLSPTRSTLACALVSPRRLDSVTGTHYRMVMQSIGLAKSAGARLDLTFAALADPTRRAILTRLAGGEASVLELAEPFNMSQPAISKHLKVLERAGLIARGKDAQRRPRRLTARPLAEATEWLEAYRQFWEGAFARLDRVLEERVREDLALKRPAAEPTRSAEATGRSSEKRKRK
jgi:DNA-binding transcriptional ArsR family regulator